MPSKDLGNPVLGGGTLMGDHRSPGAPWRFIEFLQTPIAHEVWMAQGGLPDAPQGVNPTPTRPTLRMARSC
jgi:alpha-glucoside transport system substrate-binding protein